LNLELLLSFIIATAALAISPGPDNIYVLLQSLVHGRKFGLATVAGLITGCLVHTTLVAFGVSIIIKANDVLFFSLKLIGAAYLIFLSYKVYQSKSDLNLKSDNIPKKTVPQLFKQGFIMNVLNPKVSIFFLAFFPGFLFSDSMSNVLQFYILGFIFMSVSAVIFSVIALLAGSISKFVKKSSKIGVLLKYLQILVFLGIALIILFSGNGY